MEAETITKPPRFTSEREEADWWDAHPEFVLQEFERAAAEGHLSHGTIRRREQARTAAQGAATVNINLSDVQLAGKLAERKGVEREAFLQELIHAALLREQELLDRTPAA